jgi:type I restriction enzyme M protein
MVVPNGVLFGYGVAARIKERLLHECNLHTVVRLPDGVFTPYTPIPTNLLFFEKTGRTREVWFYEIAPPPGRKGYSKTMPMRFEEFAECQAWWGGSGRHGRIEDAHAWPVGIGDIEHDDYNLDRKNPNRTEELAQRHPAQLLNELLGLEADVTRLLDQIRTELASE